MDYQEVIGLDNHGFENTTDTFAFYKITCAESLFSRALSLRKASSNCAPSCPCVPNPKKGMFSKSSNYVCKKHSNKKYQKIKRNIFHFL